MWATLIFVFQHPLIAGGIWLAAGCATVWLISRIPQHGSG